MVAELGNKEEFMKKIFIIMFLVIGIVIMGCAQKKVVQPVTPEQQQQKPPSPSTSVTPKETTDNKGILRPWERVSEKELAKVETKEEPARYAEEKDLFADIHFDYDKYDVREEDKPVLQNIANWLLKNTSAKLSIEGHCDERGTNEYNLALGDRRAKAARDYLIALGIASGRVEMLSYGEEMPFCKDQTEECWAKNRRDHFVVLKEAGK
jgi:peptidoglycan-associated lipoprotein